MSVEKASNKRLKRTKKALETNDGDDGWFDCEEDLPDDDVVAVVSENNASTKRSAETSVKKASKKSLQGRKKASETDDGDAGSIEGDEDDDVEVVAQTSAENQVSLLIFMFLCKLLHFYVNY